MHLKEHAVTWALTIVLFAMLGLIAAYVDVLLALILMVAAPFIIRLLPSRSS